MKQDFQYALRMLAKSPGFSLIAVLTLALGLGANVAIFSVMRHVLLNTLPYRDPDRLVMIWLQDPEHGFPKDVMSYPRFLDTRELKGAFSGVAAFTEATFVLLGVEEPEQVRGAVVSADFFRVMGVPASIGRGIESGEDEPGRDLVVVLSHGFWARRFGADPQVTGRKIRLNSRTYEVIGVMPSSFEFPGRGTELWIPMAPLPAQRAARVPKWLTCVARLKDGVTMQRAQAELDSLNRTLGEKFPQSDRRAGTLVTTLHDEAAEPVKAPLIVVSWAVGCVLLIACANVASMMLARAAGREREISVRLAMGARPARIVQQLLTESLVLFLAGGAVGMALAYGAVALLVRLAPANLAMLRAARVDVPVLLFGLALAVATGVIFGLIPAIGAVRGRIHDVLKQRGAAATHQRFRNVMVMSQIALAIVLLAASGLLVRSFLRLQEIPLGFRQDHLLTFSVTVPRARYPGPKLGQFFMALDERLKNMRGAQAAGGVAALLLGELPNAKGSFTVEGRAENGGVVEVPVAQTPVTPGFFAAFGQRLIAGRDFSRFDGPESPMVAIVNERMAKMYWPNQDPVGRRFKLGGPEDTSFPWLTIAGVTADTRRRGLDKDVWLEAYVPVAQQQRFSMTFIVRTPGDPLALAKAVRDEVRAVDRDVPIASIAVMDDLLDDRIAPRRFHMLLLLVLAGMALVLAGVGLYGVLAYLVTLRTQEMGVRMALGATRGDVLLLVARRSVALAAGGIVSGLLLALAATRLMASLLFGVTPHDPVTLLLAVLAIAAAAAAATIFPALRAANVDPMVALRYE